MSLKEKIKIIPRNKIVDERGWFYKVINGREDGLPERTGEVYLTCGFPNQSKGGHYHLVANEWFTLIKGNCILKLVDIETNEIMEIDMSQGEFFSVFVPSKVAHIFINQSLDDFLLLAYTDQIYNQSDTIAFDFKLNI